ncbi:Hypothetical predicted protein, partial [Paramuricea clavata]
MACFANDIKVLKQVDKLQDTVGLQNDIENKVGPRTMYTKHGVRSGISGVAVGPVVGFLGAASVAELLGPSTPHSGAVDTSLGNVTADPALLKSSLVLR